MRSILIAGLIAAPLFSQSGDLAGKLDDYLTRLQGFGFSGVAVVAEDGHILIEKGYGLADRAHGVPMTADTVISIGSITKQFTAAAILKLEMQGKLRTSETIGRFFPNAPQDKKAITLHQLLTHTAGLRSDYSETDYDPYARDEYVERIMGAPLMSPPGTSFQYSNSGYSLLAAIVEIASGQSYERYMYDNLFQPAGMLQTGYKIPKWPMAKVARGYQGDEEWGTILEKPWAPDGPYWELRGNGGIHSTVGDMYRWHVALENDTVLSKEARAKFQTGYVAEGPAAQSHYAYGWSVTESPRGKLIEHNGGNGIYAADFLRYVDAGVVVFVASNSSGFGAPSMSHPLGRIALGLDYANPPKTISMSSERLAAFAGTYTLPSGGAITIRAVNGGLEAAAEDQEAYGLLNGSRGSGGARQNQRIKQMIEAAAKGDFAPFSEAFPEARRAAVKARMSHTWHENEENFGKFKAARILGTGADGPGTATLARIEFERGSVYVRYFIDPEGVIVGMMMLDQAPGSRFAPEANDKFVSFQLPGPLIQRLQFKLNADGTPSALEFGDVAARKIK